MNKETFFVWFMTWLSTNAPALIGLLQAAAPVLALAVVGYVVHALSKRP